MPESYPRLGELEHRVMDVLWDCPDDLCARQVLERLAADLAYTTVATVLTNLTRKGMLVRTEGARSWAFRPTTSRSAYVAGCMVQSLRGAEDRSAALAGLVAVLTPPERDALRAALDAALDTDDAPVEAVRPLR